MREEKRKQAVALKYHPVSSQVPTVTAKGRGKVAENILSAAREHAIPVQSDPSLLELLSKLDVNESIPEELYGPVAEVFAFIYKLDRDIAKNK
ncbi:EscU/YscU/HrcU family type III secretion system export apparatus switch protein [Bacillus massiliglaciei]|uniref:EscU/YscU/HrcU family type III secretion system export apparatus switch protein n=1 Tax=Bacillus massiliglaciei TaxID=1816693 RepID=UPI000B0778A4|nr:EscU/YscU/HrcU family type III secretion system export apparatus switch protein [Bacillus massiliglaciei]